MADGVAHLASIIAAHLREWDTTPAFVEQAIFASEDAPTIAAAIDGLCRQHPDARVAGGLFYQSSIGSVAGVTLSDSRKLVIKTHQPAPARLRRRDRAHSVLSRRPRNARAQGACGSAAARAGMGHC